MLVDIAGLEILEGTPEGFSIATLTDLFDHLHPHDRTPNEWLWPPKKWELTGQGKHCGIAAMRSMLFAPGNHPRRVEKAFQSGADAVVLDLEDAVPSAEKERARVLIKDAVGARRACGTYVRINAHATVHWRADLEAVIGQGLDGIVLPKTESVEQIREVEAHIAAVEQSAGLAPDTVYLIPLIESAQGVLAAVEIARCSRRVQCLAFGGADYTLDLDLEWSEDEQELAYARATLTHASRAARIEPPIDSPTIQIRDRDRLRTSAQLARRMGFQGKLCIHPEQVACCNEIFTPSAAQIQHAHAVIAAFEQAEAAGSAALQLDGALIDYAMVRKARRVLEIAERLSRPHF